MQVKVFSRQQINESGAPEKDVDYGSRYGNFDYVQ